jgi:alpha-galactosidase
MIRPKMIAIFLLLPAVAHAYDNGGIGALPLMGWSTWCTDDLCGLIDVCTEKEVKSVADAMIAQGLDKLGYTTLLLDDCWADKARDAAGRLQPNPKTFPSSAGGLGLGPLAEYLHARGLYLGAYTSAGKKTCKDGRPGSWPHYARDAQTFANWTLDLVKADNCGLPSGYTERALFANFSHALNATGRRMAFSLCEWGVQNVTDWGWKIGQQYRIQADHLPLWRCKEPLCGGDGVGTGQGTAARLHFAEHFSAFPACSLPRIALHFYDRTLLTTGARRSPRRGRRRRASGSTARWTPTSS